MTGLDWVKDQIIEIACIITDKNLIEFDEGIRFVVHVEQEVLDRMGEWCQNQHGKSGLSAECIQSNLSLADIDRKVRDYIEGHLPKQKGRAILAGNSVYADKIFIEKDMPLVHEYLHHRIVDVSSIKELAKRWNPKIVEKAKPSNEPSRHRALDDIQDSIAGL
ncbi:ribonuclease H-like domain-containing protein [Phakopsora pachyrhizi]|uniref:Ribonuclease H-like domain-containing protein n=1 Tax=Phakopsora pachyrhizi TaxID=170000 RepID=A0AAV0BR68_PHAPC|nr:ribonuclease H-like domain-containing protein [Phakopsora pachyrhizi]CAH7688688.1 ribonuclease H-like domain-containing protein [Phakopsora pachyrhizi]